MRAILRVLWADLRQRKGTSLLQIVVLTASALLMTAGLIGVVSADRAFEQLLERTHGPHLWLVWPAHALDEQGLLAHLRAHPEVAEISPIYDRIPAQLLLPGDRVVRVWARAYDPQARVERPWLVQGRWPTDARTEIAIDANLARAEGVEVGTQVTLRVGSQTQTRNVVGTFVTASWCAYPGCQPAQVLLPAQAVRELVQHAPTSARVVFVRLREPQRGEQVLDELLRHYPPGTVTGYTWLEIKRYAAFETRIQSLLLFVFAAMAWLAGGFLTANTVAHTIRSHARTLAILQALGFTQTQLLAMYLAESALLAGIAGLVGGLLGGWLGRLMVQRLYRAYAASGPGPTGPVLTVMLTLALLTMLAAAWALRPLRRWSTVTVLRFGVWPLRRHRVRLPRLPIPMAQGLADLWATPGRTLLTVSAIAMVTLALVVAFSLYHTTRTFVRDPVRAGLVPASDVYFILARGQASPRVEAWLEQHPRVQAWVGITSLPVYLEGERQPIYPRFIKGEATLYANTLLAGRLPQAPDEVVAGYTLAHQHGWAIGDTLTLYIKDRAYQVRLVGLYRSTNNLGRTMLIPMALLGEDEPSIGFYVKLRPGTDPRAFLEDLRTHFGASTFTSAEVTREILQLDRSAADMGTVLVLIAALATLLLAGLAGLGILSSLGMHVAETRGYIAILKALGMTRGQILATVETMAWGLTLGGYLVGLPLGWALARALFYALGVATGLGPVWIPLPGWAFGAILVLLLGMASLAALGPGERAARLPVTQTLREITANL